jgi:hypothetical protein
VNKYAKLCRVTQLSGPKVRYYSIQFEGNTTDEIEDFMLRHESKIHLQEELDEIIDWLDGIAHLTGALETLFRHERKASALPPENNIRNHRRKQFSIQYQEVNHLRLYLIRLNENVVILLNGGEKTTRDPERCPNVRRYFKEAQKIAEALEEAIKTSEIKYVKNHTDLLFSSDFEICIS